MSGFSSPNAFAVDPVLSARDSERPSFLQGIDDLVIAANIAKIQQFSFMLHDIPFHVTHKKDAASGVSRVCIQAILGYLPFSVESAAKRQAILSVLSATRGLSHVRFGLDFNSRVFAAGNFTAEALAAPNFIFFPLVQFMQEAQPFIDVIATYI